MDEKVEVKLYANCGCGVIFRIGQGRCFHGGDVINEAVKHAEATGHKMEFFGQITPPAKPVFISEQRDKRRSGDTDNYRR